MNWIDEKVKELFTTRLSKRVTIRHQGIENCTPDTVRTALEEARTQGVEEGRRERDEKDTKTLTELSIETGNQEYVERAKRKLIQQGAQEALAKVEEWVKENTIRDFELKVYNIDADELMEHLQQLKDNKTV